jgi:hypothetical protein
MARTTAYQEKIYYSKALSEHFFRDFALFLKVGIFKNQIFQRFCPVFKSIFKKQMAPSAHNSFHGFLPCF